MNKLLVSVSALAIATLTAHADTAWSWWLDNKDAKTDVAFGLGSKCAEVDTLELSAIYGASPVKDGVQWSILGINDSDATCALQMSFWFNRGDKPCVQLGCLNVAKTSVFDFGFVNIVNDAKVQIGFLNFNKKGFLPVFPFVNFDPTIFD